ncbi:MAG: hypothetical protein ACXADC_01830 [Candidatus Thorarchaeota archaeon]
MARKPIDVYQGLINAKLSVDSVSHIESVVGHYDEHMLTGQKLSFHLRRFVEFWCRHSAFLDGRETTNLSDLTTAIDLLDYFTSTSKWWKMTRDDPGLTLRLPSRDPREFIKSIPLIQMGSETIGRISGARDRLTRFLEEHELGDDSSRAALSEYLVSIWLLLCGFSCKGQGRNITTEEDFETSYDIVRILLFYMSMNDFRALTAVRQIATDPILPKIAGIGFSPGFERKLDSSLAASLERVHGKYLTKVAASTPGASRNILTNSLRILGQIQAMKLGLNRIEKEDYDSIIVGAMGLLETLDVPAHLLQDESEVVNLFKGLQPGEGAEEKLSLMTRRIEGLLVDSAGNRDYVLQYARLVPRIVALLLLVSGATKSESTEPLQDQDLKRGLILLNRLFSD